jgi:DNA-binding transcriptional MocR family regulator
MDEIELSGYGGASATPSPVSRMMASFAADFRDGRDINLGVGYVNERTIPGDLIAEATREVLAHPEKYRTPLNYGGPHGSPNLIASIRRFLAGNRVGGLTQDVLGSKDIIIGASGATSLLAATAEVLPRGIVITSDPMYYIYCNVLRRRGYRIVAVPEDDDGIDTARLREAIDGLGDAAGDVRFIYVVTINNPTATILSNERRADLVRVATDLSRHLARKVPLILDRAYEDLIHDPDQPPCVSGMLHDEMGLVHEVGTLSKILAPGLRIGYLVGPGGPYTRALVQWNSDTGFSAPLINQEIASYLLDHHVADRIRTVREGYRAKAVQTGEWIRRYLGGDLDRCTGGKAGFYYYLTLRDVETVEGSPFFRFLLRITGRADIDGPEGDRNPRVIYIPGQHCVHPEGDLVDRARRQLRISYAFEELPNIERALRLMKEAIEHCRR